MCVCGCWAVNGIGCKSAQREAETSDRKTSMGNIVPQDYSHALSG